MERMAGSVMDAMSEAVEGAEMILFCVSKKYKERCAQLTAQLLLCVC